jgi:multiple sugar transport system ATP-binding protein
VGIERSIVMSYLELKHIKKVYNNNVTAVNDFSLTVEKGEFIVFLGPSADKPVIE